MSKRLLGLAAALALGGLTATASTAGAAPLGAGTASLTGGDLVTHVAQGCGPGAGRDAYGRCRVFARPYYGPRPGFYGRRCFFRPTPFGPRRVCRW